MAFAKGESGNPAGRPKGSCSHLTKARSLILETFVAHGNQFATDLEDFIKQKGTLKYFFTMIVPFLPKEFNISGELEHNISDASLAPSEKELFSRLDDLEKRLKTKTKNRAKRA